MLYQSWDECGGYNFIRKAHEEQQASGRIIPQINEEYGYEDHYPPWGCGATATKQPHFRDAMHRIQLAWEMCMAGGYQTTGETAGEGTGAGNDEGGGWINGRGNDRMKMLSYYRIMRDCFEKTAWWKMEPANELVPYGDLCLADSSNEIIAYFRTHHARVALPQGAIYTVRLIDPVSGKEEMIEDFKATNAAWQYPKPLDRHLVVILKKKL